MLGAVDRDVALPRADLGEALGVEGDARPGAHHVRHLLQGGERAGPGEVGGDPLGLVEDHPHLLQRLEHLEAVGADVLVHPVVVDGVAEVHGRLLVAAADHEEGVLGAEVGVVAVAEDGEDVAGAVVGVEVGPVVEVAVARGGVRDRQRRLVDRVLVEAAEAVVARGAGAHQAPARSRMRLHEHLVVHQGLDVVGPLDLAEVDGAGAGAHEDDAPLHRVVDVEPREVGQLTPVISSYVATMSSSCMKCGMPGMPITPVMDSKTMWAKAIHDRSSSRGPIAAISQSSTATGSKSR